jgi:hypothetical protein
MENQQAVRLARHADPEGERTIGRFYHMILDIPPSAANPFTAQAS